MAEPRLKVSLPASPPHPLHASDATPTITASEFQAGFHLSWETQHDSTISNPTPIFPPVTSDKGFEDITAFIPHCTDRATGTQRGAVAAPDHLTCWQEPPDTKSCSSPSFPPSSSSYSGLQTLLSTQRPWNLRAQSGVPPSSPGTPEGTTVGGQGQFPVSEGQPGERLCLLFAKAA